MIVREELPADIDGIRAVHAAAFARPNEGRLVDRLRSAGLIVTSVVAVVDQRVVGSVVFSSLPISTISGAIEATALAPIAVESQHRQRGIGTALVEKGLHLCESRGSAAVVVLGDPSYYRRFGFCSELAERIASPYSGEPAWMALELARGALNGVHGRVTYPDAFSEVD